MSLYSSHKLTIETLSSPFKCCNLSELRNLTSLPSLVLTAERGRFSELSLSFKISRLTGSRLMVRPCSFMLAILILKTPLSPLFREAARKGLVVILPNLTVQSLQRGLGSRQYILAEPGELVYTVWYCQYKVSCQSL